MHVELFNTPARKTIAASAVSFLIVLCLSIDPYYYFHRPINGNSLYYVPIFFIAFILSRKINNAHFRSKRSALILSTILAISETIGQGIAEHGFFFSSIDDPLFLILSILKCFGLAGLFYIGLVHAFEYVATRRSLAYGSRPPLSLKHTLFMWLGLLAAYLPLFVIYFPGIVTEDSLGQITQALGIEPLSAHHPILHTLLIRLFLNLSSSSHTIGVALYSIFQMILLSGTFAFSLFYLSRRNVGRPLIIVLFAFFALYPVHAYFSITMWKDILFSASLYLLTLFMVEIVLFQESFFRSIWKPTLFSINLLLTAMLKKNGFIISAGTLFAMLLLLPQKKRVLLALATLFTLWNLYSVVQYDVLGVGRGSIREALSVPMQQLARVDKNHREDLLPQEAAEIQRYFGTKNIGDLYNPTLSDPVKSQFNANEFQKHPADFMATWFSLLLKYPGDYLDSFANNSLGYWYPEARHWVVTDYIAPNAFGIEQSRLFSKHLRLLGVFLVAWIRHIPVFSMLISTGFVFFMLLFSLLTMQRKTGRSNALLFTPSFLLIFTAMLSPVFCEFRYVYGAVLSAPVLFFLALSQRGTEEK